MLFIKLTSDSFICGMLYLVGNIWADIVKIRIICVCRFMYYDIVVIYKRIAERFLSVCSRKNAINCFPCFYVILEFVKT